MRGVQKGFIGLLGANALVGIVANNLRKQRMDLERSNDSELKQVSVENLHQADCSNVKKYNRRKHADSFWTPGTIVGIVMWAVLLVVMFFVFREMYFF